MKKHFNFEASKSQLQRAASQWVTLAWMAIMHYGLVMKAARQSVLWCEFSKQQSNYQNATMHQMASRSVTHLPFDLFHQFGNDGCLNFRFTQKIYLQM